MIKERSTLTKEEIKEIEEIIGYEFKNKGLLIQAFTRRSYGNEHKVPDNEMLEFFGDAALSYAVTREIYKSCYVKKVDNISEEDYPNRLDIDISGKRGIFHTEFMFKSKLTPEEVLTREKKDLVEQDHLAACCSLMGLEKYLILNKADIDNEVENKPSVREDLVEAIIGAVAVDSNWDVDKINSCVVDMVLTQEGIIYDEDDNKGYYIVDNSRWIEEVQEWFQNTIGVLPHYTYTKDGDEYICSLSVDSKGVKYNVDVKGRSKKEAKGFCADIFATKYILAGYHGIIDYSSLGTKLDIKLFDNLKYDNAINLLQELEQKGFIPPLTYEYDNLFDSNGNPVWRCTVSFKASDGLHKRFMEPYVESKKKAKKNTAYSLALSLRSYASAVLQKNSKQKNILATYAGCMIDFDEKEYVYSKKYNSFTIEEELVDGKEPKFILSIKL